MLNVDSHSLNPKLNVLTGAKVTILDVERMIKSIRSIMLKTKTCCEY